MSGRTTRASIHPDKCACSYHLFIRAERESKRKGREFRLAIYFRVLRCTQKGYKLYLPPPPEASPARSRPRLEKSRAPLKTLRGGEPLRRAEKITSRASGRRRGFGIRVTKPGDRHRRGRQLSRAFPGATGSREAARERIDGRIFLPRGRPRAGYPGRRGPAPIFSIEIRHSCGFLEKAGLAA